MSRKPKIDVRQRDRDIWQARVEGRVTYASLALQYGMTHQRIRAIVKREIIEARKAKLYVLGKDVNRDTRIAHLKASIRLTNALINGKKYLFETGEPAVVGDFLDLPDSDLLGIPGMGRLSLKEWNEITDHLRTREVIAELPLSSQIRATLERIASLHSAIAQQNRVLLELLTPPEEQPDE